MSNASCRKGSSVLVTGGAGFIGSHTTVELLSSGWDVVILDNLCNSCEESVRRAVEISAAAAHTPGALTFVKGDIRSASDLDKAFAAAKSVSPCVGVIHFAGLKAVGESSDIPLDYYETNVGGTLALLRAMERHGVMRLIFSSSATVYGVPEKVPLTEETKLGASTNPYGRTKLFIEEVLRDWCSAPAMVKRGANAVLLRYFNPVGAHPSGRIGEDPLGTPNNLMPYVSRVAVGKLPRVSVFGSDYPTRDGTGVRDYIHVVDLALGHLAAMARWDGAPGCSVYNLGLGRGYSVLEMIEAMRKASGREIPYVVTGRRNGDVAECYSDSSKAARELGWKATRGLEKMCEDLWRWQSMNPDGYGKKQ